MTREEFEVKYEQKYGSMIALIGYDDLHMELCWKIQEIKNSQSVDEAMELIFFLEW